MPPKKTTTKKLPVARETPDEVDDGDKLIDEEQPDEDELSETSIEEDDIIEPDEVSIGDSDITEEPSSCVYHIKGKKTAQLIEDEIDDLEIFGDEPTDEGDVPPEERITKPILTKYERVRILGDRRAQLTRGAKPMIMNTEGLDVREIADQELKNGVIPFIIIRRLPSGKRELWKINELKLGN
jgi:DNA-directed RNA polymerase subunit K/omega